MSAVRRALPELTSLALVVATVAAGVVAPTLPARIVVGWHVGLDGSVSLTRGPRLLGLVAVPAVTLTMYVALRVTRFALEEDHGLNTRLFEVLAHLVLAALALVQGWLLAANL